MFLPIKEVIFAPGDGNQLTKSEQRVMEMYRSLNHEQKESVERLLSVLLK